MNNIDRIREMRAKDIYLYRTICEIVPEEESTEVVYEIFCKIHKQDKWKIEDIEKIYEGMKARIEDE